MLVRGSSLGRSMSDYLIREIKATSNITVRLHTEVTEGHGSAQLEALTLCDKAAGRAGQVPAVALFVLIGGEPRTRWLPETVQLEWGYIRTGRADATAFAYRDGGWAGVIVGVDPDPANADRISQWARDYWEALHPTSAGGAYVNFLMDEGQDRVRASYRGNYDRLTQIKDRYDPGNTFHINQNIQPASGPIS